MRAIIVVLACGIINRIAHNAQVHTAILTFTKGSVDSQFEEVSGMKASGPFIYLATTIRRKVQSKSYPSLLDEIVERPSPLVVVDKPSRRTRPKQRLMPLRLGIQRAGSPLRDL